MNRLVLPLILVAGFVAAGLFAGTVAAAGGPAATTSAAAVPGRTIARGVRVAGVRVGGLTPAEAVQAVAEAFSKPLEVAVDTTAFRLDPRMYASAYVATAVARARVSTPGTNAHLVVSVRGPALRAWAASVVRRLARPAVDAELSFRDGVPHVVEDRPGRSLDAQALVARVATALVANSRLPVHLRTRSIPPKATAASIGAVIVINRSLNRLTLYNGAHFVRQFAVATGQAIYPTPKGMFHIVVKWVNPWWYPPTQDSWAKGLKPVPPGPGNPLGTRWMGLSVPGVGIHGTDEPSSIGYSASHGCIRMQVPDAEWLFDHVEVGTTVDII